MNKPADGNPLSASAAAALPGVQTARVVVGILGGIGAGKSYVARRAAELGPGVVVDADAIAHEALRVYAKDGRLAEAIGEEYVRDGRPDTKALGARAFEDPSLLRRLERLVHPYVHSTIKMAIEDFRAGKGAPLLVLDVPLLIEVGLDRQCEVLWYIETPDDLRATRAGVRGLSREQIQLREAFQSPRERKRARADLIIRNDVDPDALDAQLRAALSGLGLLQDTGSESRAASAHVAGAHEAGQPASQEQAS